MRLSPKTIIKNLSCYRPIKRTRISRQTYALTKTFCLNRYLFLFVCLEIFPRCLSVFRFWSSSTKIDDVTAFLFWRKSFSLRHQFSCFPLRCALTSLWLLALLPRENIMISTPRPLRVTTFIRSLLLFGIDRRYFK